MLANIQTKIFNILTVSAALAVFAGMGMMIYPDYQRHQELRDAGRQLQTLIDHKNAEIAQLSEYQRRFASDPEFVKSIAHKNRRILPGERIFIFKQH